MSACLLACLLVCMSACLPACLSACLHVCLPACLSACLHVCIAILSALHNFEQRSKCVNHASATMQRWLDVCVTDASTLLHNFEHGSCIMAAPPAPPMRRRDGDDVAQADVDPIFSTGFSKGFLEGASIPGCHARAHFLRGRRAHHSRATANCARQRSILIAQSDSFRSTRSGN